MAIWLVEQNVLRALQFSNRGYVLEHGRSALNGPRETLLASRHTERAGPGR